MMDMRASEIHDGLTGIANACRTLPIDPGSPSIFQVTVRMADTTPYLGHRGDYYNSGAGLSEEAAWNAGLGEAVERYCVSAVRPAAIRVAPWRSLSSAANALHPSEVALLAPDEPSHPREPFLEDTLSSRGFKTIYSPAQLDAWRERNRCPQNDRLCTEAVWLGQTMLLGPRKDMDDIAEAIRKVQAHAAQLAKQPTSSH